ncbi:MAG: glycosyltransferase family 4 protein [Dehalococcoidales bacterium]|nr:glycosyltransferase family 4 protein [Dehalococcoidales bacterium]
MKIALVSPYDFTYPGGVNIHIASLKRYLMRCGHEVKIIAPSSRNAPDTGDKFIRIGTSFPVPAGGTICRITLSPRLGHTIKSILNQEKFDIVHLHEPYMPMLCSAVLRFSGAVNIGTFHAYGGKPGYTFGRPISTMMIKRRQNRLHGKIAVSRAAMQFANKYIPGQYDIIPNGIDLELFSPDVSPISEYCDGKLNILFVGRLEKQKGAYYLIKAFKQVKQEVPNARLIIVGPGTRLRGGYEKEVLNSGLSDVIFVGGKPQKELPRYYKTADVFCSPATGLESFGIVLLEAMAVGKPIVATDIEGYNSVVTDGDDGILVPPRNEKLLARALINLLANEGLRHKMGLRAQETAKEYGWEIVTQKILDYYIRIRDETIKKRIKITTT